MCLIEFITKIEHKFKFCVKLRDNATEKINKLKKAFADQIQLRNKGLKREQSIY